MTADQPVATPVAPTRSQQAPPSLLAASFRVFDLSLGQMLWSRRTIFLALVVSAPVVLGIIVRLLTSKFGGDLRLGGASVVAGPAAFGMFIWILFLRIIIPLLGVFYGTSLIADEVEDKTITYLFTRPISRGAVVLGKYMAYLVATVLVVLPSVMLLYFLVVPIGGGSLAAAFPALVKDLGLLGLGLAVYGAVFAWVGSQFNYPLVTGLLFAFGWEQGILLIPGYLKRFTVAYYIQGLVPHAMPQDSTLSILQVITRDSLSMPMALLWLAIIWFGFLALATWTVGRREYVLEQ
jgi:ABC-type transport system involved in multi-copper enzyme maturation permease subunit